MIDLLLRLYPPAWRARYGDELRDLVSETGIGPRIAFDVARAAVGERRRSLEATISGGVTMSFGPAWRHPTGWALLAVVVTLPTAVFVAGSLLAYQLGIGEMVATMESANAWLNAQPRVVDLVLVLAPLLGLLVALVPLVRLDLRPAADGREALVAVRLRPLNVAVAAVALLVGGLLVWHILAESILLGGA